MVLWLRLKLSTAICDEAGWEALAILILNLAIPLAAALD